MTDTIKRAIEVACEKEKEELKDREWTYFFFYSGIDTDDVAIRDQLYTEVSKCIRQFLTRKESNNSSLQMDMGYSSDDLCKTIHPQDSIWLQTSFDSELTDVPTDKYKPVYNIAIGQEVGDALYYLKEDVPLKTMHIVAFSWIGEAPQLSGCNINSIDKLIERALTS